MLDPFVTVSVDDNEIGRTKVISINHFDIKPYHLINRQYTKTYHQFLKKRYYQIFYQRHTLIIL